MIGCHTAVSVVKRGHELTIIHRASSNLDKLNDLTFQSVIADLSDESALIAAMTKVDAVVNCAAPYPIEPIPWREEAIKRGRASNNDKTRFRQLAVNYEDVKYKGVPCIQYQGISEGHGTNGIGVGKFSYFQNYGFICRTKLNNWTAIFMELSHRSPDKEMPEILHDEAKDFFDDIELTE